MTSKPNAQYNLATPNSAAERIGGHVRRQMFDAFLRRFRPEARHTVLDIGVTSDRTFTVSNYFEALYPFPARITAAGIDDACFLQEIYPGLKFVQANALYLPFKDNAFDFVHASAVLEHVGSFQNQTKMVMECLRVARLGICLTTPNRWFPVEFHTQLPLIHWLPASLSRALLRRMGYGFFAEEENLNLMSRSQLGKAVHGRSDWTFEVVPARLVGCTSNLMLFGVRNSRADESEQPPK